MFNKFKIRQRLSLLKSGSELHLIVANTGWLFADRILRMGANLFVGVWIARHLGVEQYGLFNYAVAFVALFVPIANLGLDNIVIRQLVRNPENKTEILGTTFCLRLLGGISSLLLAVICAFLLPQNDPVTIWLIVILATTTVFRAFDTIDLWFQSQVRSKYTVIAKNIAFIIVTIFKIILITFQAPLLAFGGAVLAELSLAALGLVIMYHFEGNSLWFWRWNLSTAQSLLKESWSLILSGLTIIIYMKIDQIMLGQIVGSSAVGIYSAAAKMSEVWYFIPTAISSSVAPKLYKFKEESETIYYRRLKQLIKLLVVLALVIALPITFISGNLITLLFGQSYIAAGSILAIHVWACIFVFMGIASSPWFVAEGLTHFSLHRTLAGAIINIILNFLLIPKYGGVGAAIATVISQAVASFLGNAMHPQTRKIFWIQIASFLPI
ncbi:flippase [Mastigocoleus sp. MO_188.B34]|uniref:flippase n=1 Tax=Mastigocoleus sp. MO_188.B34 TaxID=3036635 RepID=UPI002636FFD4|nr:flippase [Mastigocoleus sp. MO_188.B34]MDJ0693022.1 flippase [Mastigocoleus sp. MO_188.B34]